MKKIFFAYALLGCSLFYACQAQEGEQKKGEKKEPEKRPYDIRFTVKGLEDTVAYLGFYYGDKKYLLDTARVEKGGVAHFIDKKVIKPGVYFLYTPNFFTDVLINQSLNFAIETSTKPFKYDVKIKGSKENEKFREFQMTMVAYQKERQALIGRLDSSSTQSDTLQAEKALKKLNEGHEKKLERLREETEGSYLGQILTMVIGSPELKIAGDSLSEAQQKEHLKYYKDHYFDGIDFDSDGIIRSPNFHNKIKEYIERFAFSHPDSTIASMDYLLDKMKNNEELYSYWLSDFLSEYQTPKIMGMDKVFVHLADNYYLNGKADWADSTLIADLKKELVFFRDNQIGAKAPQIYLSDTLGQQTNLYGMKADYLVLYFYDPDCGHCRSKTPDLMKLYQKMKGKFDLAAVCVATDKKKWKDFVKEFDLSCINLADPDYKSNFRVQYDIRSTPQIYVLDKDKTIIAKKLDIEQLEDFLDNYSKREALKPIKN